MSRFGIKVDPQALIDARTERRVSRDALSAGSGVSKSMIREIEHGRSNPGPGTIDKLVAYFGPGLVQKLVVDEGTYTYTPPVRRRPVPVVRKKSKKVSNRA